VEENREPFFLAPLIDRVGGGDHSKEHPCAEWNLEAPRPLAKLLLKVGHDVLPVPGVEVGDRDSFRMKGVDFIRRARRA